MNNQRFPLPDTNRSRLRETVAKLGREISRVPRAVTDDGDRSASNGLLGSFRDLVEQLALGPEPEVRECPICGHTGMRAATRCGYCWTSLTPLGERDGGGRVERLGPKY